MTVHVSWVPEVSRATEDTHRLNELSNEDLLSSTKRLVGASNQILAALLAHLGEVQARGIHRERACASLYTYCLYELRLSEDAAFRRAKAARFVREFPKLLGAIARGELHLTGLLLLGPHLTAENLDEVLALAKHRTKREILALVRKLDPLPDVPPRIEPLGPAPARLMGPAAPSWSNIVKAFAGPVRELPEGGRPADWVPTGLPVAPTPERQSQDSALEPEPEPTPPTLPDPEPPHLSEPQRYKVEFTASQAYVDLLEEARDLLSHRAPNVSMDELHVCALELLVAELRKQKYATSDGLSEHSSPLEQNDIGDGSDNVGDGSDAGRRGSRHIPAAVRRTVAKRDGGRCTYVDPVTGNRCRETRLLEFHHHHAHALGGPPTDENLSLRCAAHNALAAEQDFGRDYMHDKITASPRQRGGSG